MRKLLVVATFLSFLSSTPSLADFSDELLNPKKVTTEEVTLNNLKKSQEAPSLLKEIPKKLNPLLAFSFFTLPVLTIFEAEKAIKHRLKMAEKYGNSVGGLKDLITFNKKRLLLWKLAQVEYQQKRAFIVPLEVFHKLDRLLEIDFEKKQLGQEIAKLKGENLEEENHGFN